MKQMASFLALLAGGYVLLLLTVFLLQGRMIYYPVEGLAGTPADAGLDYEDVWLEAADGVRLHGWWLPAPGGGRGPGTAVFCHGNAGNVSHRLATLRVIHGLGLSCLLFDYRGYGRSQGEPSEQGLYMDAAAAWEHAVAERGVEPGRVVLWGRSLGGAVAARLARERSDAGQAPGALILESTFSSAVELGRRLYPYLPVRLLSRHRYPAARAVAGVDCPVLVMHSPDDDIVPLALGRKVYEAAPEPKRFFELAGGHNDGPRISPGYAPAVQDFLREFLPGYPG
jgi:hypothetical protein